MLYYTFIDQWIPSYTNKYMLTRNKLQIVYLKSCESLISRLNIIELLILISAKQ